MKLSWNFSKGSHMIHLYISFIDWAEMLILPYISLIMVLRVYYFLFLRPFKPVKWNFILLKYLMHLNQNMGGGVYQTCASRKILNFAHPVRRQKHKEAIFWPIHTTTPSRIWFFHLFFLSVSRAWNFKICHTLLLLPIWR